MIRLVCRIILALLNQLPSVTEDLGKPSLGVIQPIDLGL